MSQILYDPNEWLVSLTRALEDYVKAAFDADYFDVQMSFPDTTKFSKKTPFAKTLIHIERDEHDSPLMGFGNPGKEVYDQAAGTWKVQEATQHLVNYDVGIWASAESGGETNRMQAVQVLTNLFNGNGADRRLAAATNGIHVISFTGGSDVLDRVNDLPIWRAVGMTLIVRVFSRREPPASEIETAVDGFTQTSNLTIDGNVPVT